MEDEAYNEEKEYTILRLTAGGEIVHHLSEIMHHFWTFRFLLNVVNFHAKSLPPLDSNAVIRMDFPAPLFFHDGLLGWFVWLMLILNQCNLPKKGTLAFYL